MIRLDLRVWDNFHSPDNCKFRYSSETGLREFFQWVGQHPNAADNVSEFTGILDDLDKKIFEGDIVDYSNSREGMKFNAEVVYDTKTARFRVISSKYKFDLYDRNDYYGHITVVGNIFQTPELLP